MTNSQRGFGLVGVLISLAVTGAIGLVIVDHLLLQRKVEAQQNVAVVADKIKNTLVGLVISPAAWQTTETYCPTAFHAQPSGGSNSNALRLALYLDPAASSPYYDSRVPTAGFDRHGDPCNGFSMNGSDTCPFRYDLQLKSRTVVNGTYVDTVHFQFYYKPQSHSSTLNGDRAEYTFDLTRNYDQQSVETSCILVGGHFDTTTGSCSTWLTQDSRCSTTNGVLSGPSPTSTQANCATTTMSQSTCPTNTAVTGFTQTGTPVCGQVPGT